MTEWRILEDFIDYSVSDQGEIRRDDSQKILTQYLNNYGIGVVGLMRDGVQYKRSAALIVAREFVDGETAIFDTPICMDGDRLNTHPNNLVWRPRWFALKYNRQFVEPPKYHVERHIRNKGTLEVFIDSFEAAKWYGVLETDLVLSMANRTFVWPTYHFFEVVES